MLIWLNGPFGGGKTQTAHELSRRLPGSVVCDPEHAGFGMHRMLPRELRKDFQDLRSWREAVVEVLNLALRDHEGPILVPMTITDPTYFEETVGRLREQGHEVHHTSLLARRETVLRRLGEREISHRVKRAVGMNSKLRGETWAVSRLDECLDALRGPEFAAHLWTDDLTIPQVADEIARRAGITPLPNTDTRLQAYARRTWTSLRHIRFD